MAPPRGSRAKAGAAEEEAPARPAYYVATADILTEVAEDRMQVCAFRAGDHVPADLYDGHPEWQQFLATPDEAQAASAADAEDQAPSTAGGDNSAGPNPGSEE